MNDLSADFSDIKERAIICQHPNAVHEFLGKSPKPWKEGKQQQELSPTERLQINCHMAGLQFHGHTPGGGNSFFHAVVDQLILQKMAKAASITHLTLRKRLVQYMKEHPLLKCPDGNVDLPSIIPYWEVYLNDMKRDSQLTDAVCVTAMAHMLQRDILIVTSSPQSLGRDSSLLWVVGKQGFVGKPLMLGHIYEKHYQSLQPKSYMSYRNNAKIPRDPTVLFDILEESQRTWREHQQPHHSASERLKINCQMAGLQFHGCTPGDGNCFFHAVADQLALQERAARINALSLREKLVQFMKDHPILQGPDGNVHLPSLVPDWRDYLDCMQHDGEWADAVCVTATAHMLQNDILIVTSSPQSLEEDSTLLWIVGKQGFVGKPLMLGHIYENHYQSLQPIIYTNRVDTHKEEEQEVTTSVEMRHKDLRLTQEAGSTDKIVTLLQNTIWTLCSNSVPYGNHLKIQGRLAISADETGSKIIVPLEKDIVRPGYNETSNIEHNTTQSIKATLKKRTSFATCGLDSECLTEGNGPQNSSPLWEETCLPGLVPQIEDDALELAPIVTDLLHKTGSLKQNVPLEQDIIEIAHSPNSVSQENEQHSPKDPSDDICSVCYDEGTLVCCDRCPRVYHITCHVPALPRPPGKSDPWQCNMCIKPESIQLTDADINKNMNRLTDKELKVCQHILLELYCLKKSVIFHSPVPNTVPNYKQVIKKPMDFSLIRAKLYTSHPNHYHRLQEFLQDIELVFSNCLLFNRENPDISELATEVRAHFIELVHKLVPCIHVSEEMDLDTSTESQNTCDEMEREWSASESSPELSVNRKRRTIRQKYQALKEVEIKQAESSIADVARNINVPASTLRDWVKNADKIKAEYKGTTNHGCNTTSASYKGSKIAPQHHSLQQQSAVAFDGRTDSQGNLITSSLGCDKGPLKGQDNQVTKSEIHPRRLFESKETKKNRFDTGGCEAQRCKDQQCLSNEMSDIETSGRSMEEVTSDMFSEASSTGLDNKEVWFYDRKTGGMHTVHIQKTRGCRWCHRRFKYIKSLKQHIKRSHPEKILISKGTDSYRCRKRFRQIYQAQYNVNKEATVTTSGSKIKRPSISPLSYTCAACGQAFVSQEGLETHALLHERSHGRTKCRFCGREFKSKSHLVHHGYKDQKERPNRCINCERSFRQACQRNIHIHIYTSSC